MKQPNQTDCVVIENYRGYKPPVEVAKSVRTLLRYVKPKYLVGLKSINLTNSNQPRAIRRQRLRSRKCRVRREICYGLYHGDYIEIYVDNLLRGRLPWMIYWPMMRKIVFAMVLYHEIGHHIHYTRHPEYRERENIADVWRDRLIKSYFRKRYWYIRPIRKPLAYIWRKFTYLLYGD